MFEYKRHSSFIPTGSKLSISSNETLIKQGFARVYLSPTFFLTEDLYRTLQKNLEKKKLYSKQIP